MEIKIRKSRDRIELRCGWRPSIADECKSIPGWSWAESKKCWTYPLTMNVLRELRRVFGQELVVDPELWEWAKAERRKEKQLKVLGSVHDARLRRVPQISPTLAKAMADRTYQRSGARFGAVAGSFLLADEPGLGKTATALAALMEADCWAGNHLVIAPKTSLSTTWARQIMQWGGKDIEIHVAPDGEVKRAKFMERYFNEKYFNVDKPGVARFMVVNPAMVSRLYGHYCKVCEIWEEDVKAKKTIEVRTRTGKVKKKIEWPSAHHMEDHKNFGKVKLMVRSESWPQLFQEHWTSVIVDESHDLLAAYVPSNISQATQGLLDLHADHLIALTGTPLRGQERRIWGTLNWLDRKRFKGYWTFMNEYFEVANGYFGSEVVGLDPAKAFAFHQLLDRYVLRRTRAEVRPDLPIGQRIDVLVEMSPKHAAQYKEFEELGETQLEQGLLAGQGMLSELTRLKQLAYGMWHNVNGKLTPMGESPKADWLLEDWLKARGIMGGKGDWLPEPGEGYKYIVASQSTEVLSDVARRLTQKKIQHLVITGDVPQKQRDHAQRLFQSGDITYRVLLLQTKTGGVSLDLDAWCDEMVILDETFIADDQVQLEGRNNNRSGRVAPRSWWYVRTADTIDQKIAESNYSQHNMENNLLDGRRGVKLALHLLKGDDPK